MVSRLDEPLIWFSMGTLRYYVYVILSFSLFLALLESASGRRDFLPILVWIFERLIPEISSARLKSPWMASAQVILPTALSICNVFPSHSKFTLMCHLCWFSLKNRGTRLLRSTFSAWRGGSFHSSGQQRCFSQKPNQQAPWGRKYPVRYWLPFTPGWRAFCKRIH